MIHAMFRKISKHDQKDQQSFLKTCIPNENTDDLLDALEKATSVGSSNSNRFSTPKLTNKLPLFVRVSII